jgi:hypothetical protein
VKNVTDPVLLRKKIGGEEQRELTGDRKLKKEKMHQVKTPNEGK